MTSTPRRSRGTSHRGQTSIRPLSSRGSERSRGRGRRMPELTMSTADQVGTVTGPKVIVLGRQGAGKGTQCIRLATHLGVPHISTGDLFRAAIAAGTPFGIRAQEYV